MIVWLGYVATVETEHIAWQVCLAMCARQLAVEQGHQLAVAVKR
jgi:hypothetical protein